MHGQTKGAETEMSSCKEGQAKPKPLRQFLTLPFLFSFTLCDIY